MFRRSFIPVHGQLHVKRSPLYRHIVDKKHFAIKESYPKGGHMYIDIDYYRLTRFEYLENGFVYRSSTLYIRENGPDVGELSCSLILLTV